MNKILMLLLLVAVSLFSSLVMAWGCETVWAWLVADSVGPGPSLKAWFGITSLFHLVVNNALVHVTRTPIPDGQEMSRDIGVCFGTMISVGLVVGYTWCVSQFLGWI